MVDQIPQFAPAPGLEKVVGILHVLRITHHLRFAGRQQPCDRLNGLSPRFVVVEHQHHFGVTFDKLQVLLHIPCRGLRSVRDGNHVDTAEGLRDTHRVDLTFRDDQQLSTAFASGLAEQLQLSG